MKPIDPLVESLVAQLQPAVREAFEERAGIMQFEAGRPRELAEALALLDTFRTDPLALTGAVCASGLSAAGPVHVLAADLATAKASLSLLGATGARPADLAVALASLGGSARLTPVALQAKKSGQRRIYNRSK